MRKLIFLLLVIIPSFNAFAQDSIEGIWYTEKEESKVEIYKNQGKYYGKIVWLANKGKKNKLDVKNPDPDKRNQPILGLEILKGLRKNSNNVWEGEIYAPKKGLTTQVSIKEENNTTLKLAVSYMGFSKKLKWKKISS